MTSLYLYFALDTYSAKVSNSFFCQSSSQISDRWNCRMERPICQLIMLHASLEVETLALIFTLATSVGVLMVLRCYEARCSKRSDWPQTLWSSETSRHVASFIKICSTCLTTPCVTTPSKSWRSSRTSVESLLMVCWWPRSVGGHTNSSGTRETRETCDRLLTVRVQTACEKVSRWGAWGCIDVLNYVLCTFFEWAPHIVFYSVSSENILYLVYASCMLVTLVTVFCFFQDHCGGLELLRHHPGHGSYAKHCGRKASLERSSNVTRCHVFLLNKYFLNWKSQLEFKSQCNRVELLSFRSVVQTGNAPGSDFVWILRKYRDTVRFTFWWQHGAVGSCVNLMNFVAQLILRVHKLRSCCECGFSSFTTRHPFKTENVKRSKRTTRRFPTHEICTTLHQLVCELWGLMTGCWYLKTLKNCSVTGLVMVKVRSLALIL